MKDRAVHRKPAGPVTAALGVDYGPVRMSASWGSAGCPIAPRAYRTAYGEIDAPAELKDLAENTRLKIGDLDREFWDDAPVTALSESCRQIVGRELGRLQCPPGVVALPAGLPLAWVVELPLRTRTRNAVERLVRDRGKGPLEHSLLVEDVMAWHTVGVGSVLDLLCVLESAELGARDLQSADPDEGHDPRHRMTPGERSLYDLAAWALSETDALTLGDIMNLFFGKDTAVSEWRNFAELPLYELANRLPHPYALVDRWADQLPERWRLIFMKRLVESEQRMTLQELGDRFGVTRERVRQLEEKVRKKFYAYAATASGRSIKWRIETIRRSVNVAVPVGSVEGLLLGPADLPDYSSLFLNLAGPYSISGGWLVLQSALHTDPTKSIIDAVDEYGRIDMVGAGEALRKWGLDDSLHLEWLSRDDAVHMFKGRLIRSRGPAAEKLALSLHDLGGQATAEKIRGNLGLDRNIRYVKNLLSADDRFTRAARAEWALTSWGLPVYTGIASSIRRLLEETGPMRVGDVAARLEADFGIKRSSTNTFCEAAAFVVEDGLVRLRREGEAYVYKDASIGDAKGVFDLGGRRVGLLFRVDWDVLRGSGRSLGAAAGAILGVAPNDRLVFHDPNGLLLNVSFPDTTIHGPSLGSSRELAEAAGAELDGYLNLVLDRADRSVLATATTVADHDPGWSLAARLTGIDQETGLGGLASALRCAPEEVESVLRNRGDHVLAETLPTDRS